MTRRQKASCSDIPDGYPASHADSFDTELGHSPGHSNAFDSRASNSQAEATGSHRCRHGWHPRWRRHAEPAGCTGGGDSQTRSLAVPASAW